VAERFMGSQAVLGWVGINYVLTMKGLNLGLVPAVDLSNFIDLGVTVRSGCGGCLPAPASLVGTIGI
jgi:hypothetical protein